VWSFARLPFELFDHNTRNILPCLSHCLIHENGQRWTVFGFKSCDISIYWWIWMWSFLLEQIWIGIDDFLLNFIATFGSVLGLQVTAGPQVNSGLQPPTRWEPFVAGTMLRRPEPTKQKVEPIILSIIAIAITHWTTFTLLLLLRIQRYMLRDHIVTWA